MIQNKAIEQLRKELSVSLKEQIAEFRQKGVVIWGAGSYGLAFKRFLKDFGVEDSVKCFCDSYTKDGEDQFLSGKNVLSPHEACRMYPNAIYVIASSYRRQILKFIKEDPVLKSIHTFSYNRDPDSPEFQSIIYTSLFLRDVVHQESYVCNYLKFFDYFSSETNKEKLQVQREKILELLDDEVSKKIFKNRVDFFSTGHISCLKGIPVEIPRHEYFDLFEGNIGTNEVFVDCGAYTGDSVSSFVEFVENRYKKVLAFEPDTNNYKVLLNNVDKFKWENVDCIRAATGLSHTYVNFSDDGGAGASLSEGNSKTAKKDLTLQIKLDEYIEEKPTFIKMDIEGAELDCLKGAENVIRTLKPKLAVCLYHKPMDLFEIPLYLKSIVPEYHFVIRQNYHPIFDTVLYAFL